MIISGNSGISQAGKVYGIEQAKSAKSVRSAGKSSQGSDAVVLSTEAQALQQTIANIKTLPEVRQSRVQDLMSQVDSGQYQVDAAKIADQMIGRALADRLR